jgi:CHAT domain-containing protein
LGLAYISLNRNEEAIALYQQALVILREIGDRASEGTVLANIGILLQRQEQTELAIVFLKQSVNVREAIRGEIRGLETSVQQFYAESVAGDYRRLANLLLQQDRVLEAQQVLDLLKIQELEDYLRNVRGNEITAQGLTFWEPEQQILKLHDSSLAQSKSFEEFLNTEEVATLINHLRRSARGQTINPAQLVSLQSQLKQLRDVALFYPLVLDDRLELVLILPTGEPIRRTIPVKREDLNQAIAQFRSVLTDRRSNPLPEAQQLYQWLIQPIASDLQQAKIGTILYAADSQLRDSAHWSEGSDRLSLVH